MFDAPKADPMTASILHRTVDVGDLEIRSVGDKRTVHGTIVPFNRPAEIRDSTGSYIESFAPSAFTKTIQERGNKIKLLGHHRADQNPLGRATGFVSTPDGLQADFLLARSVAADEALSLIEDGVLTDFSIGFRPKVDDWAPNQRAVTRTEVALLEVSLVAMGVYADAGATVAGIRSEQLADLERRIAFLDGRPAVSPLPLEQARRRLALLTLKEANA
jgi:HK97 family phage prohead protease